MTTPSPDCARLGALLLDYAYGEVEGGAQQEIARHLSSCARCEAELRALQSTRRMMGALPAEAPPEAGLESLLDDAHRRASKSIRPRWLRWAFALVPTMALAGLALLLVPTRSVGPTSPNARVAVESPSAQAYAEPGKKEAKRSAAAARVADFAGRGTIEAGVAAKAAPRAVAAEVVAEPPAPAVRASNREPAASSVSRIAVLMAQAAQARSRGDHRGAAQLYEEAFRADPRGPDAPEALFLAGQEQQAAGDVDSARATFAEVAHLFPRSAYASEALARGAARSPSRAAGAAASGAAASPAPAR